MWHITSKVNTDENSRLSDTDSVGSGLLIWNPGHHEVKYFPLFNRTQYPWMLCIFCFKCFLSLILDCFTNNHCIRKGLKWRAARKHCWKVCSILALRLKGWQWKISNCRYQAPLCSSDRWAKLCQFCTVFCKQIEVTPFSGKGRQLVKIQVERQSVTVGFSRAFFMGELKCVGERHHAWLVVPLGTVRILMAVQVTFSLNVEICMKFKKKIDSSLIFYFCSFNQWIRLLSRQVFLCCAGNPALRVMGLNLRTFKWYWSLGRLSPTVCLLQADNNAVHQ